RGATGERAPWAFASGSTSDTGGPMSTVGSETESTMRRRRDKRIGSALGHRRRLLDRVDGSTCLTLGTELGGMSWPATNDDSLPMARLAGTCATATPTRGTAPGPSTGRQTRSDSPAWSKPTWRGENG